jgi:hypothetical protein
MIHVPSSVGDAVDRVSILHIKSEKIKDPNLLERVIAERDALELSIQHYLDMPCVADVYPDLKHVNEKLWDTEDALRKMEDAGTFDGEFVTLARSVYITNDHRALLKKFINDVTDSELAEVKWYDR